MKNKEKRFVSAVVYLHNCEDYIGKFLSILMDVMARNFDAYEIICVNDDSQDRTVERLKDCIKKGSVSGSITLLDLSYFHGIETAMIAGVDLAIGDYVYEFDSIIMDYGEELIRQVYERALEGYDVVSASPQFQKAESKLFYRVFEKYSKMHYRMRTESFRILSRRLINRIQMMHNAVPYRKAVYAANGLRSDVLIYDSDHKKMNKTSRERSYRRGVAVDTLLVFTDIGYRFSLVMTLFMMLISLLMVVYTVIVYISSDPVEGWTTTVLFLAVAFFGLFGILAIIIKYLQLQINLMYRRKRYTYTSIEKLTR